MKKVATLLAVAILSLPLFARPALRLQHLTAGSPESLNPEPVDASLPAHLLGQLHEQYAKHAAARGKVGTMAIVDSVSARSFIFPVAGSAPGGGGSLFFRSDVTLVNYAAVAQKVLVGFWLPGTTNSLNPSAYKQITLQPNQFVTVKDFVATTLGTSGVGTLVFIPFTGTALDPNGAIDGFSRIYTKQPGSNGTVSQPFDAIDPDTQSVQAVDEGVALGLRQDADFRVNYGVVNVNNKPHTFKITIIGENSTTNFNRTVPAYGLLFEPAPAGNFGAMQILYQVTDAGTDIVTWVGFASSTDNITGDGWVSIASADLSPNELDSIGY